MTADTQVTQLRAQARAREAEARARREASLDRLAQRLVNSALWNLAGIAGTPVRDDVAGDLAASIRAALGGALDDLLHRPPVDPAS